MNLVNTKLWAKLGIVAICAAPILAAVAQEYTSYAGNSNRTGRHNANPATEHPGLMKLKWADPTLAVKTVVDNWDTVIAPGKAYASFNIADWSDPLDALASTYDDLKAGEAPYRYTLAQASDTDPNKFWGPLNGPAKEFSWTFPEFVSGDDVELFVNIPVGPTDVDPAVGTESLRYQARYQVYRIDGVDNPDGSTNPFYEKVDTLTVLGGRVRLGLSLGPDTTFHANGTQDVKITLINTIPRNSNGALEDPEEGGGIQGRLVYADSAIGQKVLPGVTGTMIAQPVVGRSNLAGDPYPFRVVAGRNEPTSTQVGSTVYSTSLGVISNYRHNGLKIDATEPGFGGSVRRNLLWSWPVKRPFTNAKTAADAYNLAKSNWLGANGRYQQTLLQDNQSAGVASTGGWTVQALPNQKGVDALTTAAVTGAATEQVTFTRQGMVGAYKIQVWSPGGTFADRVVCQVKSLGITIASGEVDLDGTAGWKNVVAAGFNDFTAFGDLQLVLTNETNDTGSVGNDVVADQVRFVRTSDMRLASTPVFTTADIQVGASLVSKDVVVVALENGRLYCLDAQGDPVTGLTTCYWAYPSERASDPNHVATEDGADGIAEMPSGFDTSSALVERVQTSPGVFEDLLYIGSRNGKVYCIEMRGRGDQTATEYGSTRRRWSWPDDFPAAPSTEYFGAITGSISFSNAGGTPKILVPTPTGRLYALDAVGTAATKTTTVTWQFPAATDPAMGAMTTAPVADFGRVYLGTGDGRMVALDATTGLQAWQRTNGAGGAFTGFLSSPTTAPDAALATLPDTVFFSNGLWVYAVRADNGATLWEANETNSSATQPLTFTYKTNYLTTGLKDAGGPVVVIPSADNSYHALLAENQAAGNAGTLAWSSRLNGAVTPFAVGGRQLTNPIPADLRFDEEHTMAFGADDQGNLIAYGYDPDFPDSNQWLPVGPPPIPEPTMPNDPSQVDVGNIARNCKVGIILESDLYNLMRTNRTGSVKRADITAALTNAAAITRRHYEFGERLNLICYDLPDPASLPSGTNYSVEFNITTPGASSQRRSETPKIIVDAVDPNKARFVVSQVPIVGTGNNAVSPGPTSVKVSVIGYLSSGSGQAQNNAVVPSSNIQFGGAFHTNNPLGLRVLSTAAPNVALATTGNPLEAFADGNGNQDLDNATGTVLATQQLLQGFAPALAQATGITPEIAHGNLAQSRIYVYDRSCMTTLLGLDRGLPNVRTATRDLAIQGASGSIPAKALGANYPLFEQPISRPNGVNISLDYPDVRRGQIEIVKEVFGNSENPQFTPISLNPPAFTVADYTDYKSDGAAFNAGLTRTTQATAFDYRLSTPRFQPPSDYRGMQYIYVDANRTTASFVPGSSTGYAYREFTAEALVGLDERLSVAQESIDLGVLMGGAGFAPGVPFAAPGINFSAAMFNPTSNPFFQRFSVMNEGNVNLLNVRLAKQIQNDPAASRMGGPGIQTSAWLNIARHLHSDLDPEYAPAGTNRQVAIQKARPGDLEPTRLRVNPIRRPNAAIGATQVPLLNTVQFPPNVDPRVAVSIPIGAAMGNYQFTVTAFEDRNLVAPYAAPSCDVEASGTYEPYADPFVLKYYVGETRITNARPTKGAAMIDDLGLVGKESHRWGNLQPSMVRDSNGHVYVAYASERKGSGNTPDWAARVKNPADASAAEYRLYIATLRGGRPGGEPSPVSDLDQFSPAAANRWFVQELAPFPDTVAPETLFGLGAGESVQPGSIQFGWPTFPSGGVYDGLTVPDSAGRNVSFNPYIAFVAEFNKVDGTGVVTRESRLFLTRMIGTPGSLSLSAPVMLNVGSNVIDPGSKIGRPTLIQDQNDTVTVFFPITRGGQGQIVFGTFSRGNWRQTIGSAGPAYLHPLSFSNAFELMTNPTAFLRHDNEPGRDTVEFAFIGRVRGRSASEVMLGRMVYQGGRVSPLAGSFLRLWDTQVNPLEKDARTGIYWMNGVNLNSAGWNTDTAGTIPDPSVASFVDVFRQTAGSYTSIIKPGTRRYSERTNDLVADCTLGGTITINLTSGSVQFDGAIVPKTMQLVARYQAQFVRISAGQGANYRGVSMTFDDRIVGEDTNWYTAGGAPLNGGFARNDRFVFTYLKEDQESRLGAQALMRTFRMGVILSQRLLTDNAGNYSVSVTGNSGPYQVDPVNNRIYFTAEDERDGVRIVYTTATGSVTENLVVGVLGEASEFALPMTPGVVSMQVMLDAQNRDFNSIAFRRASLLWLIWASTQQGVPDIYMGTVAPAFNARP